MRDITYKIVGAFEYRKPAKLSNTESTGEALYLHGNKIAEWDRNGVQGLWISNAGWSSNTTKERLNGLSGVSIHQKDFEWYLNGKKWNGSWVNVSKWDQNDPTAQEDNSTSGYKKLNTMDDKDLKTIAMIAQMGEIFGSTTKQKNDWKARMLKAGLSSQGLIMPEDWETLSEEEKEKRLNGAINEIK